MRYHTTTKGNIPFTAEEELEADLREAEWLAGQADRDIKAKIADGETYIKTTVKMVVDAFN